MLCGSWSALQACICASQPALTTVWLQAAGLCPAEPGVDSAIPSGGGQSPFLVSSLQTVTHTSESQGMACPPEECSETSLHLGPCAWAGLHPECRPLWPLPHPQQRELLPEVRAQHPLRLQCRLREVAETLPLAALRGGGEVRPDRQGTVTVREERQGPRKQVTSQD